MRWGQRTRYQRSRYALCFLVAASCICQDPKMKHFLWLFLPDDLTAQNMQQLTEQLGKTVLYGDIALSPDGTHLAWVQSTAATTSKQTYIRETSGNAPAKLVKLPIPVRGLISILPGRPIRKPSRSFPAPAKETSGNSGP